LYRSLLLFIVCGIILVSFRTKPEEGIRVSVTNLRNNDGHVLVSLFKDGAGYPDEAEKAIRKGKVIIRENKAWIIFTGLPPGNYAVAILHDENDDMKMNKNGFGIPKEGYGFSNNVMGTFGPPSFTRASFRFGEEKFTEVSIKTRY
jgi:uncharacterized protein (DUF2141 family)